MTRVFGVGSAHKGATFIYLSLNPPLLASQSPALGTNGGLSYMLGIGIGVPITVCVNLGSQQKEGSSCSTVGKSFFSFMHQEC